MATACAAAAAVSSSATFLAPERRIASASQNSPASRVSVSRVGRVRCAREDGSSDERSVSRRQAISLATLSVLLLSSDRAQAKDIPLFGFRKQIEKAEKAVESAEKAVVKEVKELAKEGEKELEVVSSSVQEAVIDIESGASVSGISPFLQAGGVAGAELVAVLVASSAVNGLLRVPSK